jgi:putative membrane protein
MNELIAMITERPYVLAFLASFLVIALAERGWQRTLIWLVSGTFIGWLVEFSSTRNGFPFGDYAYNEANFPDELWIGGVPFFASLSFAFMTYFGYSVACTLLSGLERRGNDIVRSGNGRIDGSIQALLLAALITTWMDTVIDPVAHLGEHWFLGDLYAYEGNGVHFDVPLTNYAGWLFTSLCIVFVNQRFDGWLRSTGRPVVGLYRLPYQPLWALGSVLGNFAFMIAVSLYLWTSPDVPSSEQAGGVLLSALVLSGLFVVFAALMLGRGARRVAAPAPT